MATNVSFQCQSLKRARHERSHDYDKLLVSTRKYITAKEKKLQALSESPTCLCHVLSALSCHCDSSCHNNQSHDLFLALRKGKGDVQKYFVSVSVQMYLLGMYLRVLLRVISFVNALYCFVANYSMVRHQRLILTQLLLTSIQSFKSQHFSFQPYVS